MSRMNMRGRARWRVLAVLVLAAVAAAIAYGWMDYQRFARTPLAVTVQAPSIDVGKGSSLREVVGLLRAQHATTAGPLIDQFLKTAG